MEAYYSIDIFRMQLELSCRLAQAKLFSRGRAQHTTPLLELSLTSSLYADVTISEVRLRRIIISITNPLLSLSDGNFLLVVCSEFQVTSFDAFKLIYIFLFLSIFHFFKN